MKSGLEIQSPAWRSMTTLLAPESNAACSAAVESSTFQPNDEAFTTLSVPVAPSEHNTAETANAILSRKAFLNSMPYSLSLFSYRITILLPTCSATRLKVMVPSSLFTRSSIR